MPNRIQLKRGINTNIKNLSLLQGEPAFVTDTGKLYIGDGNKEILINAIDKQTRLDIKNSYTKIKVNEYGQVIEQAVLEEKDIPTLTTKKISDLGTCANVDIGSAKGQIPTLDVNGKFPVSTIADTNKHMTGAQIYYTGTVLKINFNGYYPFNTMSTNDTSFLLNSDGSLTVKETGFYLVSYSVSSNVLEMNLALSNGTPSQYYTGTNSKCISIGVTPFCNCAGNYFRNITGGEKVCLVNLSSVALLTVNGCASLVITKVS